MSETASSPKAVFLLGFLPDPRMESRMAIASRHGAVHAVCWDRGAAMVPRGEDQGNWHLHAHRYPASGISMARAYSFLLFARDAWRDIVALQPHAIHFQGLDLGFIVYAYRLYQRMRSGAKKLPAVVMEIADIHPLLSINQPSKWRRIQATLLSGLEGVMVRRSDALVLTSQRHWQARYRRYAPEGKTAIILNAQSAKELATLTARTPHRPVRIGYFGMMRYKDQLRHLVDAAERAGVHIEFAGIEADGGDLEQYCSGRDYVTWKGSFRKEDLPHLYEGVDLTYCVYDASLENVRCAVSNKFVEGIAALRPVMVASGTYQAEIATHAHAGIAVDSSDAEDVACALSELVRHPEKIIALQEGCRRLREELLARKGEELYEARIASFLGT